MTRAYSDSSRRRSRSAISASSHVSSARAQPWPSVARSAACRATFGRFAKYLHVGGLQPRDPAVDGSSSGTDERLAANRTRRRRAHLCHAASDIARSLCDRAFFRGNARRGDTGRYRAFPVSALATSDASICPRVDALSSRAGRRIEGNEPVRGLAVLTLPRPRPRRRRGRRRAGRPIVADVGRLPVRRHVFVGDGTKKHLAPRYWADEALRLTADRRGALLVVPRQPERQGRVPRVRTRAATRPPPGQEDGARVAPTASPGAS